MRNVNEFVWQNQWGRRINSNEAKDNELSKIIKRYNTINKDVTKSEKELEQYWKILEENGGEYVPKGIEKLLHDFYDLYNSYKTKSSDFGFYQQYKLYMVCEYLITYKKSESFEENDINLDDIKSDLINNYSEMSDFDKKSKNYESYLRQRNKMFECIGFPSGDHYHPICARSRHTLIRLSDELRCIYCGSTTKEYSVSEEELKFLTLAVEERNMLLTDANENDLPFIELVKKDQEDEMNGLLEEEEKDDPSTGMCGAVSETTEYINDRVEEYAVEMERALSLAHRMDRKDYYDEEYKVSYNPIYLTKEEAENYMRKVESELSTATTEYDKKSLTIKKYEILILAGNSISELFNGIDDEFNKLSLVQAYTNLQSESYRENSEFFNKDKGISWIDKCTTANPEINKILLKLREETERTNK